MLSTTNLSFSLRSTFDSAQRQLHDLKNQLGFRDNFPQLSAKIGKVFLGHSQPYLFTECLPKPLIESITTQNISFITDIGSLIEFSFRPRIRYTTRFFSGHLSMKMACFQSIKDFVSITANVLI